MKESNKAVLAGGSGYLGRALARALQSACWEVVILTRDPESYGGPGRAVRWDGKTLGGWVAELEEATAIVNLTGKRVYCRPTKANRDAVMSSRVDSVRVLGEALRVCDHPPAKWIQCSSTAIYGDAGDRRCTEAAHVPRGYPMDVCVAWEEALGRALLPGMRHVVLRISFVLGADDGALPVLTRLARWGLGGPVGTGDQWISWIHEEDMTRLFMRAITDDQWEGVVNATGPCPVTNREFMANLRNVLRRPWSPAVPRPLVWLGAWLMGSDPALALSGRRCHSSRLEALGFDCLRPGLKEALDDLLVPAKARTNTPTTAKHDPDLCPPGSGHRADRPGHR